MHCTIRRRGALDQLARSLGLSVELVAEVIRQAAGAQGGMLGAPREARDVSPGKVIIDGEARVLSDGDADEDDDETDDWVLDLTPPGWSP